MLQGKKIVVYGSSGFLGRYVVQKLAKQQAQIDLYVRNVDDSIYLKSLGEPGQITLYKLLGFTPDVLDGVLAGADGVVNLIGTLHETKKQSFEKVHVLIPQAIAYAAARNDIGTFVHISALGADSQSSCAYYQSKGLGEKAIKDVLSSATILRPSVLMGGGDPFSNRFAQMAVLSPCLPLIHNGETKFQPVYVGDVADAVLNAIVQESARGQTYTLGGPEVLTFKEILEIVLKGIKRHRYLVPLPNWMAKTMAYVGGWVPGKPFSMDEYKMLEKDSVIAKGALTFKDLGIANPKSIPPLLCPYLKQYQPRF